MYLGIDLGTSGLRGVLVDEQGAVLASEEAPYPISHRFSGWSEQDPQDWIGACKKVINKIRANHPTAFAALSSIGLSGQMHGATVLDQSDQVLRPSILWNDTRSSKQASYLDACPDVRALSGNIVFPGFTAPKLLWLEEHEPGIFKEIAKVLLPKDYLRFWLTGEHVSDMSDSAGTAWFDVEKRDWSTYLLDAGHVRLDQMPRLVEGVEISGHVRQSLASSWGISSSVSVVGGGGDNAAAACGIGCIQEGDGFVSLGTSGVLFAARDRFSAAPESAIHSFCHAVPDRWYQMGVILAATDCLNWLARNVVKEPAAMATQLGEDITGPARSLFLPYLSGERTPHNDSDIRGALVGLDIASNPEALTQTVMEGVAFALRDSLEALKTTGTNLQRLTASGGGTGSLFWVKTLATVLGVEIDIPENRDFGAALGAARLAMAGDEPTSLTDIMVRPAIAVTIQPSTELQPQYDAAYKKYRALYPHIKAALQ